LALNQPEQSLGYKETFSELVNQLLTEKGWRASFLARESGLSKTTISRMLRDDNDKKSTYQPTEKIVIAVALAFKLDRAGYERLLNAAFPERAYWLTALDTHMSVNDLNQQLYEVGLPLLENTKAE